MVGIYKITSPSGNVYIGQSWKIEERWKSYHKKGHNKSQVALYNSFEKHGVKNHNFEVIHELPIDITQDVLNDYEILYYNLYKNCNITLLNIRQPGSKGKNSPESILKMRISSSNKKLSEETKRKIGLFNKGKVTSLETKEKMRMAALKRYASGNFINCKRPKSEEVKQKIREGNKGKKQSEEAKLKIKNSWIIRKARTQR